MNIQVKRFVPLVDKNIRNHAIFREVMGGKSCAEVGAARRLGESRIRRIVQDVAFATLRHTRLVMTELPVQHSFPVPALVAQAELWLRRLVAYEASLHKS